MAQSTTVDKAVVDALVVEATSILSNGGKMNVSLSLDGFSCTVAIEATVAPDVPVLATVKPPA